MKVKLDMAIVPKIFQCKQKKKGKRKAAGFSPKSTTPGHFFRAAASIRVQLMCNLSSEKMRLLHTTLRYVCVRVRACVHVRVCVCVSQ